MPLPMQPKLLRVLEEGEITPVGDTRPQKVDVRVLSATNRDLGAAVTDKTFRADLYYRLAVFPIHLPPLRSRREDIPLLASSFLATSAQGSGKRIGGIDPDALDALVRFDWPGNVRPVAERNQARGRARRRRPDDCSRTSMGCGRWRDGTIGPPGSPPAAWSTDDVTGTSQPLAKARADFEARYIAQVLARSGGKVAQAARVLGISRVALHKRIKHHSPS